MFNWLKKLLGNAGDTAVNGLVYPSIETKRQDDSESAPYKVEPPVEAVVESVETNPGEKTAPKKSRAPRKTPAKKTTGGTRGRKPKAKPAVK